MFLHMAFHYYQGLWGQACVSLKTWKLLGPEDFSGPFSGEFLGFRKAFLNAPKNTPDSNRVVFPGLQRELDSDLFKSLNWHRCTELSSSRTLKIKPSFVESQANFWPFLSFVQFQHRLLYFDWSLKDIKNVRKVWLSIKCRGLEYVFSL